MTRNAPPRSNRGQQAAPNPALAEGVALHRAGRLEAAESCYQAVKRRDPGYAEALRLRGVLAHQQGHSDAAVKFLRRAIEQQPSNPLYHHSLGEVLRATRQNAAAIAAYRRAFALQPERHATGIDLGDMLAQAGYSEDALATYRTLLAASPAFGPAYSRIATLLFERGDPPAARVQLEAWQAQAPHDSAMLHDLAHASGRIGEYERAADIYRRLLSLDAANAEACAGLGSVLQSQGHFENATHWLERALDLKSDLGWVYGALMANRGYRMAPQRHAVMRRLAADKSAGVRARTQLHFALGQLHDERAEHADAFVHFDAGNRLQAQRKPFDPDAFDERIERIVQHFNAAFFAQRRHFGNASQRPVFVVGMPRSGTSLVEQIIASHPRAFGAGELEDIGRMVRELPALTGARQRYPECTTAFTVDQAAALARRYLGALTARAPEADRVTDKMPFNMLWLGLVALLFPNARVVFCRREPMDNCLSCYFQIFSKGLRFSYDLAHLGRVYRQHERLMARWAECLPLRMLTVDYEALVRDSEPEIRRLIEFTGLPWDDRCLAFHQSRRDVRTASVWQVRQPMYQSSIARWRAYEPWLGELRHSLGR